jgi:flagellar basal-body rod protein FlgB
MAISDIPGLSALRTSMQWHQQRQRVLAENVSNADTPNYQPRDLVRPSAQALASGAQPGLTMVRTSAAHIGPQGGASLGAERKGGYETRPAGNAVSLDDEMMKVAQNQMDYQAATSLYTRSLGLLKTAIGKR